MSAGRRCSALGWPPQLVGRWGGRSYGRGSRGTTVDNAKPTRIYRYSVAGVLLLSWAIKLAPRRDVVPDTMCGWRTVTGPERKRYRRFCLCVLTAARHATRTRARPLRFMQADIPPPPSIHPFRHTVFT